MKRRYHAWKPAEPTPSYNEAVNEAGFHGTEAQWTSLTPGMRREIVRQARRETIAVAERDAKTVGYY